MKNHLQYFIIFIIKILMIILIKTKNTEIDTSDYFGYLLENNCKSMTFEWNNIALWAINTNKGLKDKFVTLLKGVSGQIKPGEMIMIMGPSGGGKSTLLNALSGQIPVGAKTQGTILYNEKSRNLKYWFEEIGYVEQDVNLIDELTIEEYLMYCYWFGKQKTKSKLQRANKNKKRQVHIEAFTTENHSIGSKVINTDTTTYVELKASEVVNNIIKELNLGKVRKNKIKRLSGGEKRRVGIGSVLVTDPSIIFLDEPTSGLDTLTALKIIKILKKLAVDKQKSIILSIHQPSLEIYYLFDQLVLLSEGNIMYYGSVHEVERYFSAKGFNRREHVTIPEHIMEICSNDFKTENPELFNSENGIFKDNIIKQDPKILKVKNDFYINIKPSVDHIYYLLSRRLMILKKKKIAFLKSFAWNFLIILIILICKYLYVQSLTKIVIFQPNRQSENIINESELRSEIILNFLGTFLMVIYSYLNASEIISSISTYFEELDLIKSEIRNQYYSASSFFCSVVIYAIIKELFICIPALLIFLAIFRVFDLCVFLSFLLPPLVSVPFGLFIATIVPFQGLSAIIGCIFAAITSFPITLSWKIISLVCKYTPSYKQFLYLTYVTILFPPIYLTASIGHIINRNPKFQSEASETLIYPHLKFLYEYTFVPWVLYSMVVVSTIICIICGIFIMGSKTKPDIRMALQKNLIQ